MARTNPAEPNPALLPLQVLVGDWEMELSNAAFLPNPSDTVKGRASFEWLEFGAFLAMRMGDRPPNPPAAVWLISRDESDTTYKVFYYDNRHVSRIYEMSFGENVWRWWRDSPNFSQRFTASISEDGNAITGQWEKSSDGVAWEHDFDVTYSREGT